MISKEQFTPCVQCGEMMLARSGQYVDYESLLEARAEIERLTRERDLAIEAKRVEIERLRAELSDACNACDEWERKNGDAPHRTVRLADRIRVNAGLSNETGELLTMEEIITSVRGLIFSARRRFYTNLDSYCWHTEGDSKFKVAWPDALQTITLEQWNEAYRATVGTADETRALHRIDQLGDCINPGCTYPSASSLDDSRCGDETGNG